MVVDVRNTGELIAGTIPGSIHIPLAQLSHRLEEIPRDRPVIVHCAGGHRSSAAASLLRKQGWSDVSDLLGGYSAWPSTVSRSADTNSRQARHRNEGVRIRAVGGEEGDGVGGRDDRVGDRRSSRRP